MDTALRPVPSVRHVINAHNGSNVEPSLGTRPVGEWGIDTESQRDSVTENENVF